MTYSVSLRVGCCMDWADGIAKFDCMRNLSCYSDVAQETRHAATLHACSRPCPSIVQGQELEALRAATPYQHIVYCGDGANDLCPALALGPTDVVLARKVITLYCMLHVGLNLVSHVGVCGLAHHGLC